MKYLQWSVFFVFGFAAGFGTLLALFLVYGDYGDETVAQPVAAPQAVASTTAPSSGPSYAAVCEVDTGNMTDPQIAAHAQQWVGQRFGGWRGWVYDVVSRADGSYNLEIAMEERGLFWSRDIVVENIVSDLALRLNVEQPVVLSGRVARVETTFETMCNPLYVEDYTLVEHH